MSIKVKFNNQLHAEFTHELKNAVNEYFKNKGISTYANRAMVIKSVVMISMYVVPYALIMSNMLNIWQMWLCCIIMGFGIAGIGFSVQHDANHGAYSKHDWVNNVLGFTLNLVGGNDYLWRIKHNILHHTYTNIHGKDDDISVVKFLRFSPHAPYLGIHRFQHIYGWFVYTWLTLFWVFINDYPKIFRYNGHGSPNPAMKHPTHILVWLFIMKFFYYFYALILPIMVLNIAWWQVVIGFVSMHLVAGFLLTIIFQLAHVVEEMEFPLPDDAGLVNESWFVHQLYTTANFAPKNKIITWFVGGLNYQVEHHLFPKICSIHYPAIAPIVKKTAEKYNIPYYSNPSFRNAVRSHYTMLKRFSRVEK